MIIINRLGRELNISLTKENNFLNNTTGRIFRKGDIEFEEDVETITIKYIEQLREERDNGVYKDSK